MVRMDKGKLKTIFLGVLIFASIFQTGKLWFGNLSGRNFFYNLWVRNSFDVMNYSEEPIYLLQPRRIVINFGVEGGAYTILKHTEEAFKLAKEEMTEILTAVFLKGEFIKEEDLNWKHILSQKSMLYQYSGVIPTEGLITDGNKIISKVSKFDQVLLVPNKSGEQKTTCYFIDEAYNKVYEVAVKQESGTLYDLIDTIREDSPQIVYISTKQSNMNQFVNNVFLPTFNDPPAYQKMVMQDPVIEKGVIDEKKLERIVDPLLMNPALKKKQQMEDGTMYYIEGSIMIKYYPIGMIEYIDQSSTGKYTRTSFIEAYQIAKGFLDKHQASLNKEDLLENPMYLSGQRQTSAGWEFYFDFRLEGIPYVFSEAIADKVNMKHAVKIVVEEGKVKLYRRLTWEGELLDDECEVNVSYLQALSDVINTLYAEGVENIEINDMYWAYYQKDFNAPLEVYWMVKVGDRLFPIKARS